MESESIGLKLRLKTDYNSFNSRISEYEEQFQSLIKLNVKSEEEFESLVHTSNDLNEKVENYLRNIFNSNENGYLQDFKYSSVSNYKLKNKINATPPLNTIQKDLLLKRELKIVREQLQNRKSTLKNIRKSVNLSDIIKGKNIDFELRENMTIREIQNFVLEKLYSVYDDSYYSVNDILLLNGIVPKRSSFDVDITTTLENYGLVEKIGGIGGFLVRITGEGAKYVEDHINAKIQLQSERTITKNKTNGNLEELKTHLTKLASSDFQEAFDELDSMIRNDSQLNKDLSLVIGRFGRLTRQNIRGVISNEEKNLEYNRIGEALIELISMINESDIA